MPKTAIVMGSASDLEVVKPAIKTLKNFGIEPVVRVISAHRTPETAKEFSENAKKDGIEVIIAAAGKAAHLAGVIASYTTLPVIGIPVKSSTMDGLDSLLSVVQMPAGVPVATVAINGGENAGLLAVQILALRYPDIARQFEQYKHAMAEKVQEDDKKISSEVNDI